MRVCPYCNKPILDDSEFCPICGAKVEVEKVGTVDTTATPEDIVEKVGTVDTTATPEDIKDWQRDEIVFVYFGLAFFVLGTLSILLDLPVWCTILYTIFCFIALAICLALVLYSHRKVTDLKKRLRGR